ncbi:MAG TPA: M14 family metallopeptidase, partial [Mycobacteriales bacterium]|nr:M14 family metallopeptidase [Mycobacteriales bacterium]
LVAHDAALLAATPAAVGFTSLPGPKLTTYRILADYVKEMNDLAKAHPSFVRLIELPKYTHEDRRVYGLEIAANINAKDGRPTFSVDGLHHAREWPAAEFPMYFAHDVIERYARGDKQIRSLLGKLRITVIPVVNPDGFHHSRSAPLSQNETTAHNTGALGAVGIEGYWRKNRRAVTTISTLPVVQTNPDAYGVDPNRNYGYLWGDNKGGSSSDITAQTYRGDSPFSEPETLNVRSLLTSRQVTSYLSNHTSGRLTLRPWGDTRDDAPDELLLERLGERMSEAMGGYRNIKSIDLYVTTGTANDWAYGAMGTLAYVLEHGQAFHAPYAQAVLPMVSKVVNAYYEAAKTAADPKAHGVIVARVVDKRGRPVRSTLSLRKSFANPMWPNNPAGITDHPGAVTSSMTTGSDGRVEWHVNPSTRPIVQQRRGTEAYTITLGAPGAKSVTLPVTVRRGQKVDLGTIRLG